MNRYLALLLFSLASCSENKKLDTSHLPIVPVKTNKSAAQAKLAHIYFLIQNGHLKEAIEIVNQAKCEEPYLFHSGLLEQMGYAILLESQKSLKSEDLITSLCGIGIAHDERLIPLVHKAIISDDPHVQLTALSVLASFENDESALLLEEAMKSNYLFVRLEAAYILATKQYATAYGQIEALMHKVDPEFKPLFPRLFAILGSHEASKMLKKLLFDSDVEVRTEAILACADYRRDDLVTEIRRLTSDPTPAQQEACCYALGTFQDFQSVPQLQQIAQSETTASLAAHFALYQLGMKEERDAIYDYVRAGNLFAIQLLAEMPNSEPILLACQKSSDVNVQVNATLSLLAQKNEGAIAGIETILIANNKDYTFLPIYSLSKSFKAWKVVSSSEQRVSDPSFFELSLTLREFALTRACELKEEDFLYIAELLFTHQQNDLIPLSVTLLQNMHTDASIQLLKKYEQKLGAPYIRNWCRLALFRMHEEGHYGDSIKAFIKKHESQELFQTRPVLPWRMRDQDRYELSLNESTRLLLECYQALAEKQSEEGIALLLDSIQNGNVHNRYTLAGLLMRSSL